VYRYEETLLCQAREPDDSLDHRPPQQGAAVDVCVARTLWMAPVATPYIWRIAQYSTALT
jgi:hypothetical protein